MSVMRERPSKTTIEGGTQVRHLSEGHPNKRGGAEELRARHLFGRHLNKGGGTRELRLNTHARNTRTWGEAIKDMGA